jgi:hypothetical protein
MAIDPAQSFSNALGQGLGIMKSYRDEARQDEQTVFDRSMRERQAKLQEDQLGLLRNSDKREQDVFDFENSPEMRKLTTTGKIADTDFKVASAKEAGVKASRANEVIDTDIWATRTNAQSNMISAKASSANAGTNARRLNFDIGEANETRAERNRARALRESFTYIAQGDNPEIAKKIVGNKVVAASVMKMAAAAHQSPVLEEIMRDPYGNWINDGKKLGVAYNFAKVAPVVQATAKAQGFKPDGFKVTNIRGARAKDSDGKPQQIVEITFSGLKTNGKRGTYTGYVAPKELFEPSAMAGNIFGKIKNDPATKQRLARIYAQADEEGFNTFLADEVARIDQMLKAYGNDRQYKAESDTLKMRRALIYQGDPTEQANIVFDGLGRAGSSF